MIGFNAAKGKHTVEFAPDSLIFRILPYVTLASLRVSILVIYVLLLNLEEYSTVMTVRREGSLTHAPPIEPIITQSFTVFSFFEVFRELKA